MNLPLNGFAQGLVDSLAERAGTALAVRLPDGTRLQGGDAAPAFTLVLYTEAAVLALMTRGHMGLLEAYFDQQVDVEGDLGAAFAAGLASGFDGRFNPLGAVENNLHEWRFSNRSPEQAKANARAHYGLGEAFYRLWLDEPLKMYTCAYWPEGTATLEQAQRQKIDHVCRKLRLAPGERYLDIGCGFGGFMFRALDTVGALGTGLNTTTEQVDWLRGEIARRGLGMLHFIGHLGRHDTELFIRKHVFPGGWIPSLADALVEMERCGLEVIDIENLRRHYAPTLDAWAERFERRWPEIRALDPQRFDERFRRIWRSYLIGCAEMFRSPAGYTHLFQIVFSKGNITPGNYPMGRDHLYAR